MLSNEFLDGRLDCVEVDLEDWLTVGNLHDVSTDERPPVDPGGKSVVWFGFQYLEGGGESADMIEVSVDAGGQILKHGLVALLIRIQNVGFAESTVEHKKDPLIRAEFERPENQVEGAEVSICQVLHYELFVIICESSRGDEV